MDSFNVKVKRQRRPKSSDRSITILSFGLFRLVDSKSQFVCELGRVIQEYGAPGKHFWALVRERLNEHQVTDEVRQRIEAKIARLVPPGR